MILGFTGTRYGMTDKQRETVAQFLMDNRPTAVHHGDCVGADSQFHDSAMFIPQRPRIEVHPPAIHKLRAHRAGDSMWPVKTYYERNQDIVNECDHLIAALHTKRLELGSGTRMTICMMLEAKKPVTVVFPDGRTLLIEGPSSLWTDILGM